MTARFAALIVFMAGCLIIAVLGTIAAGVLGWSAATVLLLVSQAGLIVAVVLAWRREGFIRRGADRGD